ncbi:MAG: hypothetical protein IBX72_03660 [Nitrospirae bacterium]|nr:hypothetical protein [Nitrospirota bacterium]
MNDLFNRIMVEPLDRFLNRVIQFLPDILTSVLIFISGIVLGLIFKKLFLRFFNTIKLDRFTERYGFVEMLKKGGIEEPASHIFSRLIGWLTMIIFSIVALRTLNVPAIERILEKFFLYLPNIFIAAVILFIGYLLGNFIGRAALITSVNAGLKVAGLVGKLVKLTIFLLAVTMALEQLAIGRGTIVITFAIIFGGVVLALAIAFGLGGRDIAKEYLEKKLKGEEKKDDISHL